METDVLAELGLTDETTATPVVATEATAVEATAIPDDFEFGELPPSGRGTGLSGPTGPRGSKYGFEKFPAPQGPNAFARKLIAYGLDADKTKRSVQSAVTAQNRHAKKAASGIEFKTRDAAEKGGIYIVRVA